MRCAAFVLAAAACTSSSPPPPPPPPPPIEERTADPCVTDCERRNMARAVAPEMIRADCERLCAASTQPSE
jgi:hypothetical protein